MSTLERIRQILVSLSDADREKVLRYVETLIEECRTPVAIDRSGQEKSEDRHNVSG